MDQASAGYVIAVYTNTYSRNRTGLMGASAVTGAKNVSPWLDEQATLRKEKDFFETRVIEYQTGAQLEWQRICPEDQRQMTPISTGRSRGLCCSTLIYKT